MSAVMSEVEGEADSLCSLWVLSILTRSRHAASRHGVSRQRSF